MNGSNGIVPTVDLATNNNAYPYPVMYGNNGGFGNGFGADALWIIVLLALFGWGNNGNGGFGGGFDNGYAWLSNGQKEIMQNTNQGFDTLHLSNQLDTINSGIYSLSNQLCNCCADMNQTVSNGFYGLNTSVLNSGFENRLGLANLNATVISENCADREALSNGIRDIISSNTANTQRILDQLCSDKIDAKNEKIADLQRELQMADLRASQIAQTQAITTGVYNELKNCPVGTTPVYGNQPIFTCNNGCGCGGFTTSQFI